jgi:hypothetical protein
MANLNLSIGDTYQGGIVFYLDGNGGGLIAAPTDQSTGTEWGCVGATLIGADGSAIGTGAQNTIDIEFECRTPGTAADICANLTLGGYSDWFLPAKDELNEMYLNIGQGNALGLGNIGGFGSTVYWSSTENGRDAAWVESFTNGYQGYIMAKIFGNYYVRAVRAFPQEAVVAQSSVSGSGDTLYLQDGGSVIIPGISMANLSIGDTYQGGIVFYLDGNGGGLIAAPTDQGQAEWGCINTEISGADGSAIGTGAQNTIDIEAGCTTAGTAADICANLTLGGYSDWFLPSKDELELMYYNIGQGNALGLGNIGYFAHDEYWSSTEKSPSNARELFFTSQYFYPSWTGKSTNQYVRAVRAF